MVNIAFPYTVQQRNYNVTVTARKIQFTAVRQYCACEKKKVQLFKMQKINTVQNRTF